MAVKIQAKPADEDIIIVIDPYRPTVGNFPRSLTPNIALFTHGEDGAITLSGSPFIMSIPGECETKGVLITAVQGSTTNEVFIRIDTEGVSVAHLGLTTTIPSDAQLEVVGDVDVLCLPVGGGKGYDPETAMKVVNAIEPRMVIPLGMESDNDPQALPVDAFLKVFGVVKGKPEAKIILKKKDLPTEETSVIVLSKE